MTDYNHVLSRRSWFSLDDIEAVLLQKGVPLHVDVKCRARGPRRRDRTWASHKDSLARAARSAGLHHVLHAPRRDSYDPPHEDSARRDMMQFWAVTNNRQVSS